MCSHPTSTSVPTMHQYENRAAWFGLSPVISIWAIQALQYRLEPREASFLISHCADLTCIARPNMLYTAHENFQISDIYARTGLISHRRPMGCSRCNA